jgi:two-component system, NarL family, nitrate/nitrite response regulator NarL
MSAADGIEVVVADDEDDIRLLLKLQLRQFGIAVVGEAADGIEAIDVCEATNPHVIILDLLMPNMNGFEAIPELRQRCPDVKIIAYSAVAGDFVRNEMARHQVPLRLKNGDAEPLVSAIRAVVAQNR